MGRLADRVCLITGSTGIAAAAAEIGLYGAPIEDHHAGTDTRWGCLPEGAAVGIPFRALIVRDGEGSRHRTEVQAGAT